METVGQDCMEINSVRLRLRHPLTLAVSQLCAAGHEKRAPQRPLVQTVNTT